MRRRIRDTYSGRGLPKNVRALGVTSFFQDVASDMVYPLLPAFLLTVGGGPALFGVMESASDAALAIVKGAAGRASDRRAKRRPFVLAGYGMSALLRPVVAVSTGAWQVVGVRVADRIAKGIRTAPRDAMIAESVEPARRAWAFSYHRGLDHLGAAVGPLVAAGILLVAPGSLRLVFALAFIPALIGLLVAVRSADETSKAVATDQSKSKSKASARRTLARDIRDMPMRLRTALGAFFVFALGNASDGFLLFLLTDSGYSTAAAAIAWSGFHVVKYSTSTPGGRLADRFDRRRVILVGWALYAVTYLGFALLHQSQVGLAALLIAYACFFGITEGAERALILDLAADDSKSGTSLGAFHATTGIGLVIASTGFGAIYHTAGAPAAFGTAAILAAIAALMLLWTPHEATPPTSRHGDSPRPDPR